MILCLFGFLDRCNGSSWCAPRIIDIAGDAPSSSRSGETKFLSKSDWRAPLLHQPSYGGFPLKAQTT
jgi:hypothetical protein